LATPFLLPAVSGLGTCQSDCREIDGEGDLRIWSGNKPNTKRSSLKKIALFADVQNIYYTTRQAFGRQFDYRAFWSRVSADREVIAAFAYAIERNDGKQKAFQQILRDIGFEVKLKPYIQRSDGSSKGDWDVGITLDLIEQAEIADVIVLASGDGDFDLALDRVYTKFGVSTEVYGVEQLTAGSLIKTANLFFAIENELLLC